MGRRRLYAAGPGSARLLAFRSAWRAGSHRRQLQDAGGRCQPWCACGSEPRPAFGLRTGSKPGCSGAGKKKQLRRPQRAPSLCRKERLLAVLLLASLRAGRAGRDILDTPTPQMVSPLAQDTPVFNYGDYARLLSKLVVLQSDGSHASALDNLGRLVNLTRSSHCTRPGKGPLSACGRACRVTGLHLALLTP